MDRSIKLTRWQIWVIAISLLLLSVPAIAAAASQTFSDVPPSDWAFDDVEWLTDVGLTNGCGPGIYCPDDPVTRRQIAAFSHRMSNELIPFVIAGIENHFVMILDPTGGPVQLGHQSFTTPTDADMTLNAFADFSMAGATTQSAYLVEDEFDPWQGRRRDDPTTARVREGL